MSSKKTSIGSFDFRSVGLNNRHDGKIIIRTDMEGKRFPRGKNTAQMRVRLAFILNQPAEMGNYLWEMGSWKHGRLSGRVGIARLSDDQQYFVANPFRRQPIHHKLLAHLGKISAKEGVFAVHYYISEKNPSYIEIDVIMRLVAFDSPHQFLNQLISG